MTRRMGMVLGGLAIFLLLPARVSLAAKGLSKETKGPHTEQTQPAHAGEVDRIVKELGLSGDKETRFRQLFGEFRQAMKEWRDQNGSKLADLHAQLKKAQEAKEETKVKELRDQIRKLVESRRAIREKFFKQLGEILTPDQVEQVKDIVLEWRARMWHIVSSLNLTDDQKTKVRQVLKSWREEMEDEAALPSKVHPFRSLLEKIATDVILTDVQRQALDKMKGEGPLLEKVMKLDLTDTQKVQVEKLKEALGRNHPGEGEGQKAGESTSVPHAGHHAR